MEKERVDVLAVKQGLFETRTSQTFSDGWFDYNENERFDKPGEKFSE